MTSKSPSPSPQKRGTRPGTLHIDKRAARLLDDPISQGDDDEMLTTEQVAEWLGVSAPFLEILRGRNEGPRFIRLSPRIVKYRKGDIRAWLRKRAHHSTKEYAR